MGITKTEALRDQNGAIVEMREVQVASVRPCVGHIHVVTEGELTVEQSKRLRAEMKRAEKIAKSATPVELLGEIDPNLANALRGFLGDLLGEAERQDERAGE